MMKKIMIAIIVFSCAVFLGLQTSWLMPHDTGKQNNEPPRGVTTPKPSDEPDQNEDTKLIVLPILGESKYLTDEQVEKMAEWREDAVNIAEQHRGEVFCSGPVNKKMVCLTFDDGPDAEITLQIIDILHDYKVKGNFFFKGNRVKKNSAVVTRAFAEGNLVLSHAYSHQELDKMSPRDIDREILAADKAISDVTGRKPALMRPPFGAVNEDVIQESAKYGSKLILWSIDTLDWSYKDRYHIAQNVLDNVRSGDIILMHSDEDKGETAATLPMIIEGLQKKGYQIVTLDKMLGLEAYQKSN
jgi:peptidoglycan/xylan/chitin deacetylase (PgdA/CDA1 family)